MRGPLEDGQTVSGDEPIPTVPRGQHEACTNVWARGRVGHGGLDGAGRRCLGKPIEHTDFHDEFTETINDFCEVSGLTVQVDHVDDGRFLFNPHGPDGLA